MDLTNKQIIHSAFGTGTVTAIDASHITVSFDKETGQKMFSYPAAFQKFLRMADESAEKFVLGQLKEHLDQKAAERTEKERILIEEASLRKASRTPARKAAAKRTAVKRTAVKKKAAAEKTAEEN